MTNLRVKREYEKIDPHAPFKIIFVSEDFSQWLVRFSDFQDKESGLVQDMFLWNVDYIEVSIIIPTNYPASPGPALTFTNVAFESSEYYDPQTNRFVVEWSPAVTIENLLRFLLSELQATMRLCVV
jgi:ubiquitin-protein ligase